MPGGSLLRASTAQESERDAIVRALLTALELRHEDLRSHNDRVAAIALELAVLVAPKLAGDPRLLDGFLLHDIGKLGIPDAVLQKPGPLDLEELRIIRAHPTWGETIIAPLRFLNGTAREVIAAHHEHWDGSGYPHGLSGRSIPLSARVFAIADAFDAMTSDRPHRRALPRDVAAGRIEAGAGSQFDPQLVKVWLREMPQPE
ncbi:MAG TPA: HD domain-containing phosphohydrolase [Gaiellaceae bacterium]|nr:HD domain-containing phosphohydrolase [Gaiellaceae bacterium]